MSEQSQRLVREGIGLLRSLFIAKENLKDTLVRQLCERVENYFTSFFTDLNSDPDIFSHKVKTIANFETFLHTTVVLLGELQGFVTEFAGERSSLTFARKLLVENDFRINKAKQIASFTKRVHECAAMLVPELEINAEARERENFQLNMSIMLGDLMTQLTGNANMTQALFTDLQKESKEHQATMLEGFEGLSELMH
jgi:hypothetical protein